MKAISFLGLCVLACALPMAAEDPEETNACQFSVTGEPSKPVVKGPDNVVPLVHIVHQPDSPLEILSIDFEDSYLFLGNERFVWERRCKAVVRNRSDEVIEDAEIREFLLDAHGGVGSGGKLDRRSLQALRPGQETQIRACGGKGYGGAKGDTVRIIVAVSSVDFAGCRYYPSMHVPRRLGVSIQSIR